MYKAIFFLLVISLTACNFVAPQLRNIEQGNMVEQEQVEQLRVGMTKKQVEEIMGSPLMTATFDPNRWQYVYLRLKSYRPIEHIVLTVEFSNNRISRFDERILVVDNK